MNDLRFALRSLARSRGFALVAIFTLALGIGANTAIFSVINASLLRPLPYREPSRLVELWSVPPVGGHFPWVTGPEFKQWRDHATAFEGIALIADRLALNLLTDNRAERVAGAEVSANYLDVLGLRPMLGRGFTALEDQVGGENHVVILTCEWWRARFGGDPTIIGRNLTFNRHSYAVIGVLPPHAISPDRVNFLTPLVLDDLPWRMDPNSPWVSVVARLRPGVTRARAEAECNALAVELYKRIMPEGHIWGTQVLPMHQVLVENSRPTFLMLLGAVALVLLIVCANLANLLLARAIGRRKEMTVRLALGAGTGRILRQMLTESVLLALTGGVLGILFAWLGLDVLRTLTADALPGLMQPEIDLRVLTYSVVLAGGTGVVFGLAPALQACTTDVNEGLKEAGLGLTSGKRTRMQSLLVVSEIALTVILLVGAGLLLRSFARALTADAGFEPRQAFVCDVSLVVDKFSGREALLQFERELVRRISALPGVEAVGTATTLPLTESYWGTRFGLSERPSAEHTLSTGLDFVGGDYFRAMGMKLLRGRLLTEADNSANAPPVVLINERLAAAVFGTAEPLGRRIRFRDMDWTIVGIVSDVKQRQVDAPAYEHVYAAHAHAPETVCLVVRSRVPPLRLAEEIRRVGTAIDPDQSLANFRSLEQAISRSLQERRVTLWLVVLFALAALALACLGLYAVMAYTIRQRERELSIRLALGAEHRDIVRHVLRDGAALGAIGLVVGISGAAVGARLIASRLYEVNLHDPLTFTAVPVIVAVVTLVATWLPARRTNRLNPIDALRAE